MCILEETHFMGKDTQRLKDMRYKKLFYANKNDKKSGSCGTHIDLKTHAITKDKDGHYIMIKESIQGEDITLS